MSSTVPTSFEFPASDETTQVNIAGSWDKWSKETPMQRKPNSNLWQARLNLNPGHVTFKFVTNGQWHTASSYCVVDDGYGGENNSRLISALEDNLLLNDREEDTHLSEQDLAQNKNGLSQSDTDGIEQEKEEQSDGLKQEEEEQCGGRDHEKEKQAEAENCIIC